MQWKHRLSLITLTLLTHTALANQPATNQSIRASSVKWEDTNHRNQLLDLAPTWDNATLFAFLSMYLHPENHHLPNLKNENDYNLQFIHAFWGPLGNQIAKYERPAKAYVFLSTTNGDMNYYVAPLIKSADDGHFYVFTKNAVVPTNVAAWINQIKNKHNANNLTLNVCTNYGYLPDNTCVDSYERESSLVWTAELQDANNGQYIKPTLSPHAIPSQHRDPQESWQRIAMHKYYQPANDTIINASVAWENDDERNELLANIASWPSYQSIFDNFIKIRDLRYFNDPEVKNYQRRIAWLFPDNGCFARTAATINDMFGPVNSIATGYKRPDKIFAFGNLCINTNNSPTGYVTWWYHTAPIVRDEQTSQAYVLDPALNPHKPLTIEEWIEQVGATTGACSEVQGSVEKINICNDYGNDPTAKCAGTYLDEIQTMLLEAFFHVDERQRQIDLNREADMVLGDTPPWVS